MRDKSWDYPPGAEHDKNAPWNQGPAFPDLDDVLTLKERAESLADDFEWLVNQFDRPPAALASNQKAVAQAADYLRHLADDLEDREI